MLGEKVTPQESNPLIATLEGFLRANLQKTPPSPRGALFNDLLAWVVTVLRRGEPSGEIALQIKLRLAQMYRSLAIVPASSSMRRATETRARFFESRIQIETCPLTASDRRFLRASAQLLTLIQRDARRHDSLEDELAALADDIPSPLIVHSIGEWEVARRKHGTLSR